MARREQESKTPNPLPTLCPSTGIKEHDHKPSLKPLILRKEVIQPQVPLRLPCYDFTPVADPTVVGCPLKSEDSKLAHRLRVKPTPMV